MLPISQLRGDNSDELEPEQNRGNDVPLPPPPPPPPPPYEREYPNVAKVAWYFAEAMSRVSRTIIREEHIGCSFKDFCAHCKPLPSL
jgi:hypothetical protein